MTTVFLTIVALQAASGGDAGSGLHYYYPVPPADPPRVVEADVVVYGATPGGLMAAIQARRIGKTAAVVEFGRHVGGMTASGLSKTDGGKYAGGISREFYKAVGNRDFPPAAAEAQFLKMLKADGVQLFTEHRLKSVAKSGNRITEIEIENGNRFQAKVFIDATYEGDLLAKAGVSYTVGREANSKHGETINGVTAGSNAHNFRFPIDPYRTPGDPASGLLETISATAPGKLGDGDRHVQAYNFRMYLSKAPNRIPFPKPADYDPDRYALLARYIAAGAKIADFMQLHEGDSNNDGGFSTDNIGGSDAWPEADYATREKIYQDHVAYQQGLLWFVTHDERVPEAIRREVSAYGLPPTDFTETGGWPHQLYVREGRRMVSDYVMTEHNCRGTTVADDSIGLAEYTMDSHHCQRCVVNEIDKKSGQRRAIVHNEGDVQVRIPGPYPVAFRAIVPKELECANLLVPVCLSATHIAYGSIRMEPVFMVLGQSAGTAAAMAIESNVAVQKVDYGKLRATLLADRQLLDAPTRATADERRSTSEQP
ncbi:MAG TPA: FAD-dependent oxidoreductase [Pirellulales bacterium]|nr:FAD-dependent oxidoreductase [Pirellulales bacterium]